MKLILIRHGQAEDAQPAGDPAEADSLRALTKTGRKRMKKAARGLAAMAPKIDVLACSPLRRAVETAGIVAAAWGKMAPVVRPELAPSKRAQTLLPWLNEQPRTACVAVVGHEPYLSLCASWLATGLVEPFLKIKKGGACMIEFEDGVGPGKGKLIWLMSGRQLGG